MQQDGVNTRWSSGRCVLNLIIAYFDILPIKRQHSSMSIRILESKFFFFFFHAAMAPETELSYSTHKENHTYTVAASQMQITRKLRF